MAKRYLNNNVLYKHKPDFYQSNVFYIHLHKENIGRMGNRMAKSDAELASLFNRYKKGKDSIVEKAVTNQYLQALNANIKRTSSNFDLLNEVFDVKNNNSSKILDQMHQTLQEGLEKHINTNNLVTLLQNEKKIKWSEKRNDIQKLQQALNTQNGNYGKEGLSTLDTLMQSMADTVQLLHSPLGIELAKAIMAQENGTTNFSTIKGYGRNLQNVLEKFKEDNKAVLINDKLMKEAIENFESIIKPLASLRIEKSNGKTTKTTIGKLQGRVTQNFFPNLAEILTAQISRSAVTGAVRIHQNARRSGTDSSAIRITDPKGNYSDTGFFNDGERKQDKADNVFENVQLNTKIFGDNYSGLIEINVGISSKSYVTNHFGIDNSLESYNDVYSLGGGMTLGNAFRILLGDINAQVYKKYLGYNIFAHDQTELPKSLKAIQDVLLTRSIVYLAAGRDKKNIAQFMMLNGKLLSVWDIIKYALDNNIGLSSSQLSEGDNNQGIYMTIERRKDIIRYAKSRFWQRRIVKTNESINNATMKAHIVPKQIINKVKDKI